MIEKMGAMEFAIGELVEAYQSKGGTRPLSYSKLKDRQIAPLRVSHKLVLILNTRHYQ